MKKAILYQVLNIVTQEKYIGVTTTRLKARWGVHLYKLRHGIATEKIQKSFDTYGENNFIISEINRGDIDDMLLKEKELTRETIIVGLNTIIGGGDSEERAASSLCYKNKLKDNPLLMDDFKKRISEANKGKKLSQSTKDRISKAHIGKKMDEKERLRRKMAYSGVGNPNSGKYKLYINAETGIYYTTPELWDYLGVNKSGMQWLNKINSPVVKNFIKV